MEGRTWRVAGLAVLAIAVLLVAGGLGFVYSGAYDVAATGDHTGLVTWALETTKDRSIRARAADVAAPPPFDSALVVSGFDGFRDMCVECHGAPGVDPGINGVGLNPSPPELGEEAHEFDDAELFWITKHGLKFTGMPAFGPTHADRDLWAVVAFIRELEEMAPEEYARRVAEREAELEATGSEGGHSHAPGTPAHEH